MFNANLALDKAPPLGVPLRFFLTAPLFGMSAALLLLWFGPAALESRWSPSLLALTHLLTLGVLTMVMTGALIQMVAVVAGSPVPRPRLLGTVVHVSLVLGTISLAVGFLTPGPVAFGVALAVLGIGVAAFVLTLLPTLLRVPRAHDTVLGMVLAVVALGATLGLGLTLASGHAFAAMPLYRLPLTNTHLTWGIGGWIGLLVIGVAYQVVPMFQITPNYPEWMSRWLAVVIFAGLSAWTAGDLLAYWAAPAWVWLARLGGVVLVAGYSLFAAVTLRLQARRRRRLPNVTTDFWRLGMVALILSGLIWLVAQGWPAVEQHRSYGVLLGVLLLVGFAVSVVNGMLYKIVPFLVWLHLQNQMVSATGIRVVRVPNMKQIIPDARARRQYRVHLFGLILLLAATLYPPYLTQAAALADLGSFALLGWNIYSAGRLYRTQLARYRSGATVPGGSTSPAPHS